MSVTTPEPSTVSVTIQQILPFGILVRQDDSTPGIVRAREIVWDYQRRRDWRRRFKVGDTLTVLPLREGHDHRMEYSLRLAENDPWVNLEADYPLGKTMEGTVIGMQNYGVFVEIAPGITGLLHITRLPTWAQSHVPKELFWYDDKVRVTIERIDPKNRRIGLSLGRALSERWLGDVSVPSQCSAPTAADALLPFDEAEPMLPPWTILVVFDDQAQLGALAKWMRQVELKIRTADTAEAALELIADEQPDLVISDFGLPGMSGAALLGQIRERWPDVRCALMTDWARTSEYISEIDALRSDGIQLLIKPLRPADIIELLTHSFEIADEGADTTIATDIAMATTATLLSTNVPLQMQLKDILERLCATSGAAKAVIFAVDSVRRKVSLVDEYGRASLNEEPFDVFLIDHRLGPGENGIDVLRELLRLSPRSEAVMFTLSNDYDVGMLAYRAGAVRYLHKPFTVAELTMVLRWIQEWRNTKRERDGLRILTDIARRAQCIRSVSELGDVIVESRHHFGFQRARFWLREGDDLVGVSQYGLQGLPAISGIRFPIQASPYAARTLMSREPLVFCGEEYGPSYLVSHYPDSGFEAASGEWVSLPLWAGEWVLGMLMLDNHRDSEEHRIHPTQLQELTLLGEHVAVALERVQLYEQEQMQSVMLARKSRDLERANLEMAVLVEMSRLATNRAATSDLDTLLHEIHGLVGQLIDARNMVIALHDTENAELDVRLRIEKGQRRAPRRRPLRAGLLGYVVDKNQSQIRRIGRAALSWLGVPLRVEGKAVGALAVQSYEHENAFTEQDRELLERLAAQVAGAIEAARLKEEAASNSRRLIVLQRAGEELMKLAEQNEDWLWHTALTIATAGYALRFNRAMLFLIEDGGAVLRGHMGIGQLTGQQARDRWRHVRKQTIDEYICALKANDTKANRDRSTCA